MDFSELKGQIIQEIEIDEDRERVTIETNSGKRYALYHDQNCCENVTVDDVIGDLTDLIGEPILLAEEVSGGDELAPAQKYGDSYRDDSFTWTFYKLSTIKGSVTIKWYGSSNGYYSESVTFAEIF